MKDLQKSYWNQEPRILALKETKGIYVLDTSAILTYIENEEGAEYVENLLIKAEKEDVIIYVAFISLTEVYYITMRERDESFEKILPSVKEYRLTYKTS